MPETPVIITPFPKKWFDRNRALVISGSYAGTYPVRVAIHEMLQETAERYSNEYELDPPLFQTMIPRCINGLFGISWDLGGYCHPGCYYVISATVSNIITGSSQQHRVVLLCLPEDTVEFITPVPGINIFPGPGQLSVTFKSTASPRCPHLIVLTRDGNPARLVQQIVPAEETGWAIPLPADPLGTVYRLRIQVLDPNIWIWPGDDNAYTEWTFKTGELPPLPLPKPPIPPAIP